jgi:hypothetical protein
MLFRQLPRLCRSLSTTEAHIPSSSTSLIPINLTTTAHRDTHSTPHISKPISTLSEEPSSSQSISLTHSRENGSNSESGGPSDPGTGEPLTDAKSGPSEQPHQLVSVEPSKSHPGIPSYPHPPFHTHQFFATLEKTFPTPTARSLMRATRALLVDRAGRVRREGLTVKDLDNVSSPTWSYFTVHQRVSYSKHTFSVQLCLNYAPR